MNAKVNSIWLQVSKHIVKVNDSDSRTITLNIYLVIPSEHLPVSSYN